jgi:hypothetical protein
MKVENYPNEITIPSVQSLRSVMWTNDFPENAILMTLKTSLSKLFGQKAACLAC